MFNLLKTGPFVVLWAAVYSASPALASTLEVPKQFPTIQKAIDEAKPGDVVLVSPGIYKERILLKPGITVRSAGNEEKGKQGLRRAESTILDGSSDTDNKPGVVMAEGAILDGFTVTNVGKYSDEIWKKHHATQGELLKDEQGAVGHGQPAVQVNGVNCVVKNCIVHHNGHVGIAVSGTKDKQTSPQIMGNIVYRNMGGGIGIAKKAEPIIHENCCFENLRAGIGCRDSRPIILNNICYGNVRAGIGNREGSKAVIRGNKCFKNRRAGIGSRMKGTAPIIENNECFENDMAGIGSRDGAAPLIRDNRCFKNKMAGIGCDGAGGALIIGNECRDNHMAGIGVKNQAIAMICQNKCIGNKLVAIGVIRGSRAHILENELVRQGGVPPIVAVKDNSTATLQKNRIYGGGVAGVLVQGTAFLEKNTFVGKGKGQGSAIWVWADSQVSVLDNQFDGYRNAVNATKSRVLISQNTIQHFEKSAIVVSQPSSPAHVYGNTAHTSDEKAQVVVIKGTQGVVDGNQLKLKVEKE